MGVLLVSAVALTCFTACNSSTQGKLLNDYRRRFRSGFSGRKLRNRSSDYSFGAFIRPWYRVATDELSYEWLEKGIENFEANNPGCTVELEYYKIR